MLSLQAKDIRKIEVEVDDHNFANSAEMRAVGAEAKDQFKEIKVTVEGETKELAQIKLLQGQK